MILQNWLRPLPKIFLLLLALSMLVNYAVFFTANKLILNDIDAKSTRLIFDGYENRAAVIEATKIISNDTVFVSASEYIKRLDNSRDLTDLILEREDSRVSYELKVDVMDELSAMTDKLYLLGTKLITVKHNVIQVLGLLSFGYIICAALFGISLILHGFDNKLIRDACFNLSNRPQTVIGYLIVAQVLWATF